MTTEDEIQIGLSFPRQKSCFAARKGQDNAPMALPCDYHMHTPLCHHAVGEPTELAARAIEAGIPEIGFSEHNPMIRKDWDNWHMEIENLELYCQKIRQAQEDHPHLAIKYGLEGDYLPGHENWIGELSERYPWD